MKAHSFLAAGVAVMAALPDAVFASPLSGHVFPRPQVPIQSNDMVELGESFFATVPSLMCPVGACSVKFDHSIIKALDTEECSLASKEGEAIFCFKTVGLGDSLLEVFAYSTRVSKTIVTVTRPADLRKREVDADAQPTTAANDLQARSLYSITVRYPDQFCINTTVNANLQGLDNNFVNVIDKYVNEDVETWVLEPVNSGGITLWTGFDTWQITIQAALAPPKVVRTASALEARSTHSIIVRYPEHFSIDTAVNARIQGVDNNFLNIIDEVVNGNLGTWVFEPVTSGGTTIWTDTDTWYITIQAALAPPNHARSASSIQARSSHSVLVRYPDRFSIDTAVNTRLQGIDNFFLNIVDDVINGNVETWTFEPVSAGGTTVWTDADIWYISIEAALAPPVIAARADHQITVRYPDTFTIDTPDDVWLWGTDPNFVVFTNTFVTGNTRTWTYTTVSSGSTALYTNTDTWHITVQAALAPPREVKVARADAQNEVDIVAAESGGYASTPTATAAAYSTATEGIGEPFIPATSAVEV
ncbi:hypothetical protein K431DRAFT_295972 [Polychaeton citri CBS 116435]|uniref:Uncharacterized protein n=1 Tax=Polychaeton citri CBS 116435 TaxID=1314669 RepID=A0A9P4Q2S7_9PEZI|nr:hypothetical protein K431DRAFT_295972 [Polychaeton citri CBS 116435]